MLGGGTFTTMNKVLPGSYINFVSAARASANLGDRGTVAIPIVADWGISGKVFTVTQEDFQKESLSIFGYDYTADAIKPMREVFANAIKVHFYRLNSDAEKAKGGLATAVYGGTRGNDLQYVVSANVDDESKFDVKLYMGTALVAEQTGIASASELADNAFVTWNKDGELSASTQALSGGTNGSVITGTQHQTALDKFEAYSFNVLCCPTSDETIKSLYVAYTKRMRDQVGAKFQVVAYKKSDADYEGVISVENAVKNADEYALVYYVAGMEAGCAVNKSCTNKVYSGEYEVDVDYKQTELEAGIKAGKLMFHQVEDEVRVLSDINTFVTVTDEKNGDFSKNQVIRVLDQIANDIATLFNKKYLGNVQNDKSGRVSFWNDIVTHHKQLQTIRAIQDFDAEKVLVEAVADDKTAVAVSDEVFPTCAMEKLYMTVVVK